MNRLRTPTISARLLLGACTALGACTLDRSATQPAPSRANQVNWNPTGPSSKRGQRDAIIVVQMEFDVLRVDLPADLAHHSEKIWNHVEELAHDPARTALLRRNGLRMGVASSDAWPAIKAIFEACQATVIRATHIAQNRAPLTLELGTLQHEETFFLLTPDDRLVGTTFDRGIKYLHLDYAMDPDRAGTVSLKVTPEIHRLSLNKHWEQQGGDYHQVDQYEGQVFHQLSQLFEVPSGSFLVIGPEVRAATSLSVGRRFLTRRVDGLKYETILCITPQPFGTKVATR